MALSPEQAATLEKVAADAGFEVPMPGERNWLSFKSTQSPLRIWLTRFGEVGHYVAGFSQPNVGLALASHGTDFTIMLPKGAAHARAMVELDALQNLVRRALQLSKSLPDELLRTFERVTAPFPKSTEAERIVVERFADRIHGAGLVDYWEGRCAVTGLAVAEVLRAIRIKPWKDCATDAERLDVFNGLLLAPHLAAAFEAGLIAIADDGTVTVSESLDAEARSIMGVDGELTCRALTDAHGPYLQWHRHYGAQASRLHESSPKIET